MEVDLEKRNLVNGNSQHETASGAGGWGQGTPKSELKHTGDMLCDEILGESPAAGRRMSQVPMRQLARKGGLLKGEAASAPKAVLSVADAVKEGILKKEREELDRKEAIEAVMGIHGSWKEVIGHAALFPGVAGPGSGRLCQCCSRPESLKSTIFCDKCERGFHVDCVKHWSNPAQELDVWHCGPCGLQPGHYWPLGRVLISYDNAVAEYRKYSSNFLTALQKKDESSFGALSLGMEQRTHEKSDGLEGSASKVKVIRDFKKEARKGANKVSVVSIASQPVVSKAGSGTPTQVKESGLMTGSQVSGETLPQPKTLGYPGFVPIQHKSMLNSVAPIVNFMVPPDPNVVRNLPSPNALVSHESKTNLPLTEYTMSFTPGFTHTGSMSTQATPAKLLYSTSIDSTGPTTISSQSEFASGGFQYQYVASPQSNVIGPSNLSLATNQISVQQKASPANGAIGIEVSSTEKLRSFAVGEPLTEREELLKEAKETLNQLRTFISGLKGNLADDWRVILRRRPTGAQEKFYLSPAKRKYRSRQDVARYLGLVEDPKFQRTKSSNLGTSLDKLLDKKEISPPATQANDVTHLPMFCGDVMIEKLGVIDSRPTYCNEHHIWPVGFRSSWHDSETGSYCISGVEDGGELGPIFRVTRKLVIGPASINNDLTATSSLGKSALVVGGIPGEAGKMKISEENSIPLKSTLGELKTKTGESSVFKVPAEGSQVETQNMVCFHGELNKLPAKLGEHLEPGIEKEGIILPREGHEGGSTIMNGDVSYAPPKNHIVASHAVGRAVIDLTEETEIPGKLRSDTTLNTRVSTLDVERYSNIIFTGKAACAVEDLKADNHPSEHIPVVIDLSDEEDDNPSALILRDKAPAAVDEDVGHINEGVVDVARRKALGSLPPQIKPLPNILMEELTVEARTPGEAWRLFGKQFVEHCKKTLGSGVNCTVPILESTNDYVIYNPGSNLGNGSTDIANSSQKSIDRRETSMALFYERLEKRLGEDHFGLNLPVVQNMIKALHIGKPVGHDKAWVKGVDQIVEAARTAALVSPPIIEHPVNLSDPWKRRKRRKKADLTGDESVKKIKSSSAEPLVPHILRLGAGEQLGIEKVVFQNAPAVVMPAHAPLLTPAMGSGQSFGSPTIVAPIPSPVIIIEEPRQPPPAGQPVLKRLPSELVGDLLQVWEFLCRFSDLFGQDVHFTLEDLEAGLLDGGPVRGVTTNVKDCSRQPGQKDEVGAVVGSSEQSVGARREEEKTLTILVESSEKYPMKTEKASDKSIIAVDRRQESVEVPDRGQGKDLNVVVEAQTGLASSLGLCMENAESKQIASEDSKNHGNESKNLHVSEGGQSGSKNIVEVLEGTVSKGLACLAQAHIPLLKFLVSDLKFRISKGLNEDEGDEPKKRGRKRICDIGPLPPEFGDDLPMNAITWPEVAHRYLVVMLDVKKRGEITELAPEECKKLVRYFEGDGGVMGGAVEGVVGVESDAQVLAEAEKELTLRMPKTVEKDIVIFVPQEWDVALTPINPAPKKAKGGKAAELPEVLPKWVEKLEPVRKMPTNLGTKLKIQVQEALDCKPPDWAKATLEWSLRKGTFKSNAAGTTKRAVLEVLAQYHGEELKAINAPRVRKVKAAPSAEHLMQRCRIVLREVAKADSKQVFSNLMGGASAVKSSKDVETLARPLDFRTIDARLAAGAYGGSTDAFAADMRQIWKNVEEVHKKGSAILELANILSQLFEKLHLKQVISLIKGVSETKDKEKGKPTDVDAKVDGSGKRSINKSGIRSSGNAVDDKLGKAPWEDDTTCRVCGIDEDYDSILLCDGCDAEYHIYCLVPPLEKVPKGNWFCPSCVAVEEGFPEAPSLGETELAALQEEMERPVAGSILKLEYEDEKVPSTVLDKKPEVEKTGRVLGSGTKSEVEVEDENLCEGLDSQPPAVESTVEALLRELEDNEYWQLSPSNKLFLFKFFCDEVLKTPQARLHLEKSVEVALEMQQQLRDLVAERLKIVVPMDFTNHAKPADKDTLPKPQTNSQQGPCLDTTQIKDGAEAVAQAARLEMQAIEATETPKAIKISSPTGFFLVGDNRLETKAQENIVGVGKLVHDLDLNVVAGKEPESENLGIDHKVSSHISPVETSKERPLVKDSGSTKRDEIDARILSQFSFDQKLGSQQGCEQGASEQDHTSRESQSGRNHVASVAEDVEGDVSNQADAALRALNPLKRSPETIASDFPSTSINGPENLKKARKEDRGEKNTSCGVSGAETNESSKESSDRQAAAAKVLEEEDSRAKALLSARNLDVKITKLGAKLFNLSLRREHMGTDHLGREYWALTGIDGRPWLVVADTTSAPQDQVEKGPNPGPGSQLIGPQGIEDHNASPTTLPQENKAPSENKQKDVPDLKMVHEGIKWIHYKGDKALDELVKWLSPRCQHERVLRIAIYHWRRSLYPRQLLDMPEITTAPNNARAFITMESSKLVDESRAVLETLSLEEMEESKDLWSFPAVKATRLLQKRYTAPNASGGGDQNGPLNEREIVVQKDSVLRRCECLELLWTSRHHCLMCHETYDSTSEFQTHSIDCPPGSKFNVEIGSKDTQPQIPPKAKKITHDGSKVALKTKKLTSFDKAQDLPQSIAKAGSATRSERTRRSLHRGGSQPIVDDDVDMEPADSVDLLSEYVESVEANKLSTPEFQDSVRYTPSKGLLKNLEEIMDPSSSTVLSQPPVQPLGPTQETREKSGTFETTFTVDDFDANTLPAKFGIRSGKQLSDVNQLHKPEVLSSNQLNLHCSNNLQNDQGHASGWVDDLNISNRSAREPDSNTNQFNCSNNAQGHQGNSGGWVNDLNISDQEFREQELYLPQSNCSSISQNGQGSNGGWMNDLNISSQSFTDQVLDGNRMNCSNTAHDGHGNSGGWANDLNIATQSFREDAPSSFGYHSPAPAMVSTPQSIGERITQIGFSDRGPSFALSVQNPLVFDSSLMIPSSSDYPTLNSFHSVESSNPAVSQYQQFMPPHNVLTHAPVPSTNFLLSLNDTNSKSVPYNQYLAPVDHANSQQLSFQQLLSSHDLLNASSSPYPDFLPGPENVTPPPLSYPNLLHSLDSRNPQPALYSQCIAPLENINLNTTNNPLASSLSNLNYTNSFAVPYVNLNSNFSQAGSHHADLNTRSNSSQYTNLNPNSSPSASCHTSLNINSSPLYANFGTNSNPSALQLTSLNANPSPAASSYNHFPLSSNGVEPENKKFDIGRFKSNSWFDSQSTPEPLERPAVIPTKPTARRSSTWDYLINLPLPSSQGNERSVQKHHAEAPEGHSSPPPIEVESLPFDLMFEKPQREDLNIRTVREDNGALALDRMFFGQQIESQINNSSRDAVSIGADSVTLDLMLEKHEQEHGVLRGATGPSDVGSLSIDLMSLPEEQIETVQGDTMDPAEEPCIDGVKVEPIEAAKETFIEGNCLEAARGSCGETAHIACTEATREPCEVSVHADPNGADRHACGGDIQVEAQGDAAVVRVEVEQGEAGTSSERRTILPPPVPVFDPSSGRKPVKRFPVANASVRSLVGEQQGLLRGLQINLLDMEAAMTDDVLEPSRALPVRRRAWRAFVKSASCIYEVTKAIVLLELMVKAENLKPNWGHWSSLSAAARSSSLSSLALRLFALDAAITYEKVKAPGDEKEIVNPSKNLKAKKKKPLDLPLPPPSKKKKKK